MMNLFEIGEPICVAPMSCAWTTLTQTRLGVNPHMRLQHHVHETHYIPSHPSNRFCANYLLHKVGMPKHDNPAPCDRGTGLGE